MVSFNNDILPRLQNGDYFLKFKFIKSQSAFRQQTDFGFYSIEFYSHKSYDLDRDQAALEIHPVYGVRFDLLMKWFEKFSFKSLSDQRNNSTVIADGKTLRTVDKFYFLDSKTEFDNEFSVFSSTARNISADYFSKYKTLDDYFAHDVLPVLNRERKMSDVGTDWIFESLTAVKLFQFDRFDEMTKLLKDQIEVMKNRNEPNVKDYYDKFDIIFKELKDSELK